MQEQDTTKPTKRIHEGFIHTVMRGDGWIWGIYFTLIIISAIEIFSASSQLTYQSVNTQEPAFGHIKYLFFGIAAVLITQCMDIRSVHSWDKAFYILGLVTLGMMFCFGIDQKGAVRSVGGFQPVEICKIGTVMGLCAVIYTRDDFFRIFSKKWNVQVIRFWVCFLLICVMALPVASQNLSSAIIIVLSSFGVMFMGKVDGKCLWWTVGVGLVLGLLFLFVLRLNYDSYPRDANGERIETVDSSAQNDGGVFASAKKMWRRLDTWSERVWGSSNKKLWEEDIKGKKSQELCAHMALVNGSPLGRFVGRSRLRDFLPEAYSDYIFAIIFEEWGPLGALFVLALYISFFVRCFLLTKMTEDPYIRLVIMGLSLIILIQALIHIGVCTGAMFVTGQPLPLISRGGSSIIGTSISFGIILALSRIIRREQESRLASASVSDAETSALDNEISVEEGISQITKSQQ